MPNCLYLPVYSLQVVKIIMTVNSHRFQAEKRLAIIPFINIIAQIEKSISTGII